MKPPEIDERDFEQLVKEIRALAPYYVSERDVSEDKGVGVALIKIFASMLKLVIDRLNRVPEKNFAAFLDMLGIQLLPAQPARAPVTFYLSEGAKESVLIPERSQASAEEIVFETEKNIVATPSKLVEAYSIDLEDDGIYESPANVVSGEPVVPFQTKLLYDANKGNKEIFVSSTDGLRKEDVLIIGEVDYALVTEVSDSRVKFLHKLEYCHNADRLVEKVTSFALFEGKNLQEHILYLGHEDLFNIKSEVEFELTISHWNSKIADGQLVSWQYWAEGTTTQNSEETKILDWYNFDDFWISDEQTNNAKEMKIFLKKETPYEIKERKINGIKSRWIRCLVNSSQISNLQDVEIDTINVALVEESQASAGMFPDMVFYNDVPLDLTLSKNQEFKTPIYPFGKIPRLYDTFYIASQGCFSKKGEVIRIEFFLEEGIQPQHDLILSWEYWNGKGWQVIEDINGFKGQENEEEFKFESNGGVQFTCLQDFQTTEINGQKNYWVRVRIISGGYGKEEINPKDKKIWISITDVKPPKVKVLKIKIKKPKKWNLQHCLAYNNLEFTDITEGSKTESKTFEPFQLLDDKHQTLYLGFDKKIEKGLSIFFSLEQEQEILVKNLPKIEWLYHSQDKKWVRLEVLDDTRNLTRTGAVEFIVPADFAKTSKFGDELYWIKAVDIEDKFRTQSAAKVKGIYPNTTFAIQAESIEDELLGSGDGSADQKFQFTRKPVIKEKEEIWVNETGTLLEEEKKTIREEKGEDYVSERKDETWVRWQAIEDFFDSTSKSRHYVVDRATGEVKFGDGERGMVPPIGRDNIKANYQVGGSERGNVGASAISTLKTSIPFVDRVTNPEAAEGGANTELLEAVFERGPHLIKHRNRAVTEEDFERLAKAASSYIARTKCFTEGNRLKILIIPKGGEDKPKPSSGLLRKVEKYLLERSLNLILPASIVVQEPSYKEVRITVYVVPESIDLAIPLEKEILKRLKEFLHPLTGGPERSGWEFGRDVHISDVYALLEGIKGVDHVYDLELNEKSKDVKAKEDETVCSGEHRIRMRLEVK